MKTVTNRSSIEGWFGEVHHGDACEVMNQMPAESVDLIVTSPPYNIKNSSGNGLKTRSKKQAWSSPMLVDGYDTYDDNLPHEEYVEWQRECLTAMMRLLPETGGLFYVHKWRVQHGMLQTRSDIVEGFPVRQIIIWQRAGGINFNEGYFLPTYEVIYLITKPEFKLRQDSLRLGDIWRIPQSESSSIEHPAPFPTEIPRRCLVATGAKIVLDPFMGSGSTGVAAVTEDRNWIGIERSLKYCELAKDRIGKHASTVTQRLFTDS